LFQEVPKRVAFATAWSVPTSQNSCQFFLVMEAQNVWDASGLSWPLTDLLQQQVCARVPALWPHLPTFCTVSCAPCHSALSQPSGTGAWTKQARDPCGTDCGQVRRWRGWNGQGADTTRCAACTGPCGTGRLARRSFHRCMSAPCAQSEGDDERGGNPLTRCSQGGDPTLRPRRRDRRNATRAGQFERGRLFARTSRHPP